MFNIVRKATGKVYGRDVPAGSVNLVLSAMPSGVYSIVDFDGIEVNLATVKAGRVRFVKPEARLVA
jgi:hypothetical protein